MGRNSDSALAVDVCGSTTWLKKKKTIPKQAKLNSLPLCGILLGNKYSLLNEEDLRALVCEAVIESQARALAGGCHAYGTKSSECFGEWNSIPGRVHASPPLGPAAGKLQQLPWKQEK